MIHRILFTAILVIGLNFLNAQTSKIMQEINMQVYEKFSNAYAQKDLSLFASLQHDDLMRVSGDSKNIKSKSEYISGLENWWIHSEDQLTISFRFFERIHNENLASEKGIYRIKVENPNNPVQYSYGEFHVILTKESGLWQFLVDYDSNKGNTINEENFKMAKEMTEF